jgi:hypothetical protein
MTLKSGHPSEVTPRLAVADLLGCVTLCEKADVYGWRAGLLCCIESRIVLPVDGDKDVAEVDAADGQTDHRVDDALDQAVDDTGKCGADDDDPGRQIDHIACRGRYGRVRRRRGSPHAD